MKKKINNITDIKIDNINLVFDIIRNNDDITRVKLATLTGITTMSVTRLITLLMDNDLVFEDGEVIGSRGRPAKILHINPSAFYTLTIYVDVDTMIIAVVDLNNEIVFQSNINSYKLNTMEDYIDAAYDGYQEMIRSYSHVKRRIKCISIVCSGVIDQKKGEVLISTQLKWRNVKIVDYTYQKFDITTIIDNDVKSALIGEVTYAREYRYKNLVYMDIGYGIGVGLLIRGEVLRGANNNAGEIGHITINHNGLQCECGRKGCLNTVLNIKAFLNKAKEYDNTISSINDIAQKYREGELWAKSLLDDVCMYFSIAVNNIIYAYDPAIIKIGGKFINEFEGFLDIMSSSRHYRNYGDFMVDVDIELSSIGDKSYIIGGAINSQKLLFDKLFT